MNRREFVKALAGVSLLGVLARLPKAQEGINLIMPGDPGYVDISPQGIDLLSGAEDQPPYELHADIGEGEDWLVERYKDENGDWHERVLVGSPPADLHWDEESLPGTSFWNGQKWIPAELQQRMCFY